MGKNLIYLFICGINLRTYSLPKCTKALWVYIYERNTGPETYNTENLHMKSNSAHQYMRTKYPNILIVEWISANYDRSPLSPRASLCYKWNASGNIWHTFLRAAATQPELIVIMEESVRKENGLYVLLILYSLARVSETKDRMTIENHFFNKGMRRKNCKSTLGIKYNHSSLQRKKKTWSKG